MAGERVPEKIKLNLDFQSLLPQLPELQSLRGLVENSDWHNDDPLDQSVRLFQWILLLPTILDSELALQQQASNRITRLFTAQNNSRFPVQHIMAFSALIHDTGKALTYQRLSDGKTICPQHEVISGQLAKNICSRFDFSPAESSLIIFLAENHGNPYNLYKQTVSLSEDEQINAQKTFSKEHADYWQLLLLFACGDIITSQLKSIKPDKYSGALTFYQLWMNQIE